MKHAYNRKKIAIRGILFIQATGFFYDNSQAWSYPVKEVSKLECKKTKWEDLGPECKQPLPRIVNADYEKYKNDKNYTLIYSTLWGAPYSDGRAYGKGSHEGVDIASSQGTPVYAMGDGIITKAGAQGGYGKVVVIKHTMTDKKVIHSIYGHLNTITAIEGNTVKEGELIGTIGNEGFSFGNHLIWDINITSTNTYAFWGCPEFGDGTSFNILAKVVDNGLCRDYLTQRTIDPIAFVESNGTILGSAPIASTNKIINKSVVVKKPLIALAPTPEKVQTPKPSVVTTTPIAIVKPTETKTTVSTPKITTTLTTAGVKTNEDFLKKWNIVVTSNFGTTLQKGGSSSIGISITDKAGANFAGVVDKEISIMPSKQNIVLSPRVIRYVNEGKIVSLIEAKEAGVSEMVVSYGDTVIGKLVVTVQ